jgi:molybdate transport system substrate-binding protein
MRNTQRVIILVLVLAIVAGCGGSKKTEKENAVLVLAAASLAPTLDSIAAHFERTYNLPVNIGYGASGTLAQQIRAGAAADLYLSADTAWIDRLQAEDSAVIDHWWPLLTNHLVVAALNTSAIALSDLGGLADSSIHHIVIADPEAAPAGRYAKASFEHTHLMGAVSGKLVFAEHVTAAVQVIRTGVADVGLAYATDIAPYPELKSIYDVPDSLHPPIVYGLAVLQPAMDNKNATAFAEYIRSDPMMSLFRQAGFVPIQSDLTQRR